MQEFFTWAMLGTYAGATIGVGILTEFFKRILPKVPTQLVSYIIAVIVLIAAAAFTEGLTLQNTILTFLNGAIVSLAANGGYAGFKRITTNTEVTTDSVG